MRLGMKRNNNFVIPEEKKNVQDYCAANKA